MVFKRDLLKKTNEKWEVFKYYGDWYFYLQLCKVADIYYCNRALILQTAFREPFECLQKFVTDQHEEKYFADASIAL